MIIWWLRKKMREILGDESKPPTIILERTGRRDRGWLSEEDGWRGDREMWVHLGFGYQKKNVQGWQ
jgi:hypothetical protein